MKNDLLEILACPCCSEASLDLRVFNQDRNEIVSGELRCPVCGEIYLIQEGIPRMVPRASGNSSENKNLKHYQVREANITYYNSVAEVYENEIEQAVHQSEVNQRRMDYMVKSLAEKTKKELFLDLGCGTGNVLKFGKKYFRRAVGVDVSFNMLMQAKRNGLEVIQADILFLPFKHSLFDVVSIFSVLHHIYDYSAVFNQIARVLRDGGYLYSDWDPTKKPTPNNRKISWGIYLLAQNLFSKMGALKNKLNPILKGNGTGKELIDFMKIRPDLKEIHSKAEFHNITEEEKRGIDFPKVKTQLELQGFCDIQPLYHQSGLSLDQLTGVPFFKSKLLTFLGFNPEPFLENILILAKKGDELEKVLLKSLEKYE
jgi:ubiquinone/menaquinone biosynthesis C-methylase UbiE/uncharacterized protein YbaR (Trm112 family)